MKSLILLFLVLSTAFFTSCASINQHSNFAENDAISKVYVIRNSPYGYLFTSKIYVGDIFLGKLGANNYIAFTPKSSEIELISIMENVSKLSLKIENGKTYYVKQRVRSGWFVKPRTKLELLTEEEGIRMLSKMKKSNKKSSLIENQ